MHCDRVVLFFVDFMDVIQFKPCIERLHIDFNDSVLGGPPPPERAANQSCKNLLTFLQT